MVMYVHVKRVCGYLTQILWLPSTLMAYCDHTIGMVRTLDGMTQHTAVSEPRTDTRVYTDVHLMAAMESQ